MQRQALLDGLSLIEPIATKASGRNIQPVNQACLIKTTQAGIDVSATDLDLYGRVSIANSQVEEEGSIAIPADTLYDAVKHQSGENVLIESLQGEQFGATVKIYNSRWRLLGFDPESVPTFDRDQTEELIEFGTFRIFRALQRIGVTASSDNTRYQLCGIYLEIEGRNVKLTATDGRRLAHDSWELDEQSNAKIIISNQTISHFIRYMDAVDQEEVEIGIGPKHVRLETINSEVIGTIVSGNYPNYGSLLEVKPITKVVVSRNELTKTIIAARLTTDKTTSSIYLSIKENNRIVMNSASQQIGETESFVDCETTGPEQNLNISPLYLLEAIKQFDMSEFLTIVVQSPERPILITSGEDTDTNYIHLCMPLVNKSNAN